MRFWSKVLLTGIVLSACAGCDLTAKTIAAQRLAGQPPLPLLGGLLHLSYVENSGAFLSLGAGLSAEVRFFLFVVLSAGALVGMAVYVLADRGATALQVSAMGMIFGGGLGNLIDRVSYGIVRDFVRLGIGGVHTGIFNLADAALVCGMLLFLLATGRRRIPAT